MYADLVYPTVGDGGNVEQVLVLIFRQDEVGEVLVGIGRTGTEKWTDGQRREGSWETVSTLPLLLSLTQL